jgi:hypothetical protein
MEHVISSQTRHYYKVQPVATAPTYTDLMQLDWHSLVPTTIIPQKGDGISVVFHELAASMEEILLEPTNFLEYIDTLPVVSQCLLHHV